MPAIEISTLDFPEESSTTSAPDSFIQSSPEISTASSTDNNIDDTTLEPIQQRDYPQEDSIQDGLPVEAVATDADPIKFHIIAESSQRNSSKLCDSLGFNYVYRYTTSKGIKKWRCATRNKNLQY